MQFFLIKPQTFEDLKAGDLKLGRISWQLWTQKLAKLLK